MIAVTERDRPRFEKFLCHDPNTGCLLFTGYRNDLGYGCLGTGSRKDKTRRLQLAHRVAWVLAGLEIPPDKPFVLHRCDNPSCCEVGHLFVGTNKDNSQDMSRKFRGPKGTSGLPFGAARTRKGRYQSQASIDGGMRHFGVYDDWQIASAVAFYEKNRYLYPEAGGN